MNLPAPLTWLIITLGLTYGVTQSAIFSVPRRVISRVSPLVMTLVYCPACAGFWAGTAALLVVYGYSAFLDVLVHGSLGGMVCGALWQRWGPEVDVYELEQMNDGQTQETQDE